MGCSKPSLFVRLGIQDPMEEAGQKNAPTLDDISSRHGASASMINWHAAQSPGPLASPRTRNLEDVLPTQCWAHLLAHSAQDSMHLTGNIAVIV